MKKDFNKQSPEHGGAGVKLIIAMAVLVLIANAGYNYVPVAYQGESFKQEMETAVVKGSFVPHKSGNPVVAVKEKLNTALRVNQIPEDSFVEVKEVNKAIQARVYYTKEVPLLPFGLYNHAYTFDYTTTPDGFLTD